MKLVVTLEIDVPDDYPDLCWTQGDPGPQVVLDLLQNPARHHFSWQKANAHKLNVSKESHDNFVQSIERKEAVLESMKYYTSK